MSSEDIDIQDTLVDVITQDYNNQDNKSLDDYVALGITAADWIISIVVFLFTFANIILPLIYYKNIVSTNNCAIMLYIILFISILISIITCPFISQGYFSDTNRKKYRDVSIGLASITLLFNFVCIWLLNALNLNTQGQGQGQGQANNTGY